VKKNQFSLLGMYVSVQSDHSVTIDNTAYVMKILASRWTPKIREEFRKTRGAPSPSNLDLFTRVDANEDAPAEEVSRFKGCIGEISLAVLVRLDILKECTYLSTLCNKPGPEAWRKYRKVIDYLHHVPSRPINLGSKSGALTLYGYVDVGYGVHEDMKSHTGIYVTMDLNAGPLYVKSQKQDLTSKSSGESELIGAVKAIDPCLFLAKLQVEMKMKPKMEVLLMEDNQSAIYMMNNGEGVGGKAKCFRIRYQFIKELVDEGILKIKHCKTEDMIPDFLTKGMVGAEWQRQVVRAMYHGDAEEAEEQAKKATTRVMDESTIP
jgi:hypothetical protein